MEFGHRNKKAAKLGLVEVRQIRQLYGEGATQSALCRRFGVSIGQIGRIVRGESWQEEAGARLPSKEEADAILSRLLAVQARRDAGFGPDLRPLGADFEEPPPAIKALVADYLEPGVSPLEGADAPEATPGLDMLTQKLQELKK